MNVLISLDGIALAHSVRFCSAADREGRREGLLGAKDLSPEEGILMQMPSDMAHSFLRSAIHMIGMRFPIAVAWLNPEGRILHSALAHPGIRFYNSPKPAAFILECHPDHLAQLQLGARLEWKEAAA